MAACMVVCTQEQFCGHGFPLPRGGNLSPGAMTGNHSGLRRKMFGKYTKTCRFDPLARPCNRQEHPGSVWKVNCVSILGKPSGNRRKQGSRCRMIRVFNQYVSPKSLLFIFLEGGIVALKPGFDRDPAMPDTSPVAE